jgi:hypothetical protein
MKRGRAFARQRRVEFPSGYTVTVFSTTKKLFSVS